ncbi:MAG: hypothetical protein AAF564_17865 [Bacteroidota bacterium]
MQKPEVVNFRAKPEFKRRLKLAASARGLSMAAYITDRMENHIRADLRDIRQMMETESQTAVAA